MSMKLQGMDVNDIGMIVADGCRQSRVCYVLGQ